MPQDFACFPALLVDPLKDTLFPLKVSLFLRENVYWFQKKNVAHASYSHSDNIKGGYNSSERKLYSWDIKLGSLTSIIDIKNSAVVLFQNYKAVLIAVRLNILCLFKNQLLKKQCWFFSLLWFFFFFPLLRCWEESCIFFPVFTSRYYWDTTLCVGFKVERKKTKMPAKT